MNKSTEENADVPTIKECLQMESSELLFPKIGLQDLHNKPPIMQNNNQATVHQTTADLEYQKLQPYKHEAQLSMVESYNSSINNQSNESHQQSMISNDDLTENSYFSNKNVQHSFPHQYYNYYDNKNTASTSNYHINNYAPYGHFNFAPYHSNFHASAGYSGNSASYINSNAFPRQPWNAVGNHQSSNESIRQQQYMGSTYSINEWSSQ